jgi:hypothetical protein
VSSKCFQLYYTCSDRLFAVVLPPCPFHLFPPLTVTFPKLAVILRPLYMSTTRLRTQGHVFSYNDILLSTYQITQYVAVFVLLFFALILNASLQWVGVILSVVLTRSLRRAYYANLSPARRITINNKGLRETSLQNT